MNAQVFKGKWQEVKGQVKAKWAKLTDDDLDYVAGRAEELRGILQKKYGSKKDKADRELDVFMKSIN